MTAEHGLIDTIPQRPLTEDPSHPESQNTFWPLGPQCNPAGRRGNTEAGTREPAQLSLFRRKT